MNDETGDEQFGGFPATHSWFQDVVRTGWGGDDYADLVDAVRDLLDNFAAAKPEADTIRGATASLREWSGKFQRAAVPERDQVYSRRFDLIGRGQVLWPVFHVDEGDEHHVRGTVRFSRYHLGGNGAVHGGSIPLLFDEVFGSLANTGGRSPSRTAFLHVNYRAIAPIDTDLEFEGHFELEEGRKRLIAGTLTHNGTLCADISALFVALLPGQP